MPQTASWVLRQRWNFGRCLLTSDLPRDRASRRINRGMILNLRVDRKTSGRSVTSRFDRRCFTDSSLSCFRVQLNHSSWVGTAADLSTPETSASAGIRCFQSRWPSVSRTIRVSLSSVRNLLHGVKSLQQIAASVVGRISLSCSAIKSVSPSRLDKSPPRPNR